MLGDDGAAATVAATTPVADGTNETILATLPKGVMPDLYPAVAMKACGERKTCRFSGWTEAAATPAATAGVVVIAGRGLLHGRGRARAAGRDRGAFFLQGGDAAVEFDPAVAAGADGGEQEDEEGEVERAGFGRRAGARRHGALGGERCGHGGQD